MKGLTHRKLGGDNLEHAYSKDEVGIKNFYLLLQISRTINQSACAVAVRQVDENRTFLP